MLLVTMPGAPSSIRSLLVREKRAQFPEERTSQDVVAILISADFLQMQAPGLTARPAFFKIALAKLPLLEIFTKDILGILQ